MRNSWIKDVGILFILYQIFQLKLTSSPPNGNLHDTVAFKETFFGLLTLYSLLQKSKSEDLVLLLIPYTVEIAK